MRRLRTRVACLLLLGFATASAAGHETKAEREFLTMAQHLEATVPRFVLGSRGDAVQTWKVEDVVDPVAADAETRVDAGGWTALHHAAERGDAPRSATLLDVGAILDARDAIGQTPLHRAAASGSEPVVTLLLARGADAKATDLFGRTPLSRAAWAGNAPAVAALLEAGADPGTRTVQGEAAIHLALHARSEAALRALAVRRNPDAGRALDATGRSALDLALAPAAGLATSAPRPPGHLAILAAAVAAGADPQQRDGTRPVVSALLEKRRRDEAAVLLRNGGAPDAIDLATRRTALDEAIERRDVEAIEILGRSGARMDLVGPDGSPPLHRACATGNLSVATAVIRAGAPVDQHHPRTGQTALHVAGDREDRPLSFTLRDAGARTDILDKKGRRPRIWPDESLLEAFAAGNSGAGGLGLIGGGSGGGTYKGPGIGAGGTQLVGRFGNSRLLFWSSKRDPLLSRLNKEVTAMVQRGAYAEAARWIAEGRAVARKDAGSDELVDRNVAVADHNLGVVRLHEGRFADAEPLLRRAVNGLQEASGNSERLNDLLRARYTLGTALAAAGKLEEAVAPLELAAKMMGRNADTPDFAAVAMDLGSVALQRGRYADAKMHYAAAEPIRLAEGGIPYANLVANRAVLEHRLGDHARAAALYGEALALFRKIYEPTPLASELLGTSPEPQLGPNGMGMRGVGEGGAAGGTQFLLGGLGTISRGFGRNLAAEAARDGAVTVHANRGELSRVRGNLAAAEADLRIAIAMSRSPGPEARRAQAAARMNLGDVLLHQGKADQALPELVRARDAVESAFGTEQAINAEPLRLLAEEAIARGAKREARKLLQQALMVADTAQDPDWRWRVRVTWGKALRAERRIDGAIVVVRQAVSQIQDERAAVSAGLGAEAGSVFVRDADRVEAYRLLADLLLEAGRLPEAAETLRLLKEEEQRELSRSGPAAPALAALPEWQAHYEQIRGDLIDRARALESLKAKARDTALDAAETAKLGALDADLATARKAFRAAVDDVLEEARKAGGDRGAEIGRKNLEALRGLQGTLRTLGPGAVAIHYLVLPDRVRILVTAPEAQVARETRIDSSVLNAKILAFRTTLQDPRLDPGPEARALYEWLLAPIEKDLKQAGATTLVLSLDGGLRYLPFAALHDGKGWMAERFAMAIFTEAARDKLKDSPAAQWRIAALGVSESSAGLAALPGVKDELNALVREGDADDDGVLPGTLRIDGAFTQRSLAEALESGAPVVHIASHFVFSPGSGRASYLVLGSNATLNLEEVQEEDLRFDGVDLLTLSACETAVGGGAAGGREIEGFAALVQNLGARSVLATLWPVADRSTGALMTAVYRERAGTSSSPVGKAEALRRAQLTFLGKSVDTKSVATTRASKALVPSARPAGNQPPPFPTDPERPFAHPYYWAPFVLMGNWR